MCTLTVIIVNFNVKDYLLQCIRSIYKSIHSEDFQIIIVDNNSTDGSCEAVRVLFPAVILIENKVNLGFSKANNQARTLAKGEFILFLNPDTLLAEDTLSYCLSFLKAKPLAGAVGVRMIDGDGQFHLESKRSMPTPEVSFYKMIGLSFLFPKSRKYARYSLGYLANDKNHIVEILSGAFIMARAKTLEQSGWFDEHYFMYGEDIDLSWRINKAGYTVYYLGETTIIHYKGESTKKTSLRYVYEFYKAMHIFANKYFRSSKNSVLFMLVMPSIWISALFAVIVKMFTVANQWIKSVLFHKPASLKTHILALEKYVNETKLFIEHSSVIQYEECIVAENTDLIKWIEYKLLNEPNFIKLCIHEKSFSNKEYIKLLASNPAVNVCRIDF